MSSYESKYPVKMKKGDVLGVAAPSSPFDDILFQQGVSTLKAMGFEVLMPEGIFEKDGFLAGDDTLRAAVLHDLFVNPKVRGIVCARGGYGSMRLLPLLDFDLIAANPKPLIGFSDATALLEAIHERTGLVCYHGPVVTSLAKTDGPGLTGFEDILKEGVWTMECPEGTVIREGAAEGPLKGGNLTTLCHLTGTAFAPQLDESILMLEDVGEAPYRIDRMLTQMRMAGLFDRVRAVVAGRFDRCGEARDIEEVFRRAFRDVHVPLVLGFPFGHGSENLPFPVGGWARFDTNSMKVSMA